ncbi:MAG: succinate dehydrogenase, hydrophobic membrane anchor protein [Rhodobacteraceae bacterium]|nr:succinate dehydrogenase, hydrophobic membrane anchor protein [Paracoccaceae bacterium]
MSYKTGLGRVIGPGSAKTGAKDWFSGRVLSVALVPLMLLFLCLVAPLIGQDYDTVVAGFANPFTALVTILCILVAFRHLADGLHEVIIDYVHSRGLLIILLAGTRLGCYFLGAAGAFSVAKIAFIG